MGYGDNMQVYQPVEVSSDHEGVLSPSTSQIAASFFEYGFDRRGNHYITETGMVKTIVAITILWGSNIFVVTNPQITTMDSDKSYKFFCMTNYFYNLSWKII